MSDTGRSAAVNFKVSLKGHRQLSYLIRETKETSGMRSEASGMCSEAQRESLVDFNPGRGNVSFPDVDSFVLKCRG